ncbi:MAG: 50S ribosomal protein L13, partial [Desulfobacterales bacterium]|nr:50S ribosomal protein L13 [Desulfobacterales bacterium]
MKKYTYSAKKTDNVSGWVVIDANGAILGRLASNVASRLRGKNNPLFTPHVDTGESVIVINAEKILLTGRKLEQKIYYRHSGYTGGLTEITAKKLLEKKPEDIIRFAVKGMLPKNKLGAALYKKLKVYAGDKHPH